MTTTAKVHAQVTGASLVADLRQATRAVEIVELDPAIFGTKADLYLGLIVEAQGRLILAMPAGQDPAQRNTIVRELLARQLGGAS